MPCAITVGSHLILDQGKNLKAKQSFACIFCLRSSSFRLAPPPLRYDATLDYWNAERKGQSLEMDLEEGESI